MTTTDTHTTTTAPDALADYFAGRHDCDVVSMTATRIELTNIPHSATHMLPGGMSTLKHLGEHWNDWNIEYVDNGDTVMYGSKPDKNVVITRED